MYRNVNNSPTVANICARKFQNIKGNWATIYNTTIQALNTLGLEVRLSPYLDFASNTNASIGIEDSPEHVYIYNHTYMEDIIENNFNVGVKTIFLKPTAPTNEHFSLDPTGYAACSSITYEKPAFEHVDEISFYETQVEKFKTQLVSKWSDRKELSFHQMTDVPKDHILVMGQMPGDATVTEFSFGNHWTKFQLIVDNLMRNYRSDKIVIKIHPTLERESKKMGKLWKKTYKPAINRWIASGLKVYKGFESLHSILPHTSVAIIENSTSGIECLMYDVPIISYGYPEYHWITYDMRHISQLRTAIENKSWYDKTKSRKWFTWYCSKYLCYDHDSTVRRLSELLNLT